MASEIPAAREQKLSQKTLETLSERSLAEKVPLENTNGKLLFAGMIIFVLIILATAGVYYLTTRITSGSVVVREVSNESQPAPATITLARSEITLEILNGSGVAGAAAKTAKIFTDLGYTIVKTGNTEITNENAILVNSSVADKLAALLGDVEKELSISSISGELIDSTSSARIILGRK